MAEALGRLSGRIPALATIVLAVAACALASRAFAGEPAPPPVLSAAQQLAIARAFAPTLIFHPDEIYFPTSSMASPSTEGWSSRVDEYRALTMPDKLSRATLAYRVFTRADNSQAAVIVEYWCYYVYNAYTIRGGWLPYRMPDNHPNDLERLYFVLTPAAGAWDSGRVADEAWARESFQISRVVANAHDGNIPPNQYRAANGEAIAAPVSILIERGSHAMAPDIDRNGRFTTRADSTEVLKVQWGIRDHGSTWGWYRQSFMDARGPSAVRLCGPAPVAGTGDAPCLPYALYPADGLQRWFQEMNLSSGDRNDLVGKTPWLVKAFGDIRVEDLMVPADAADGRAFDRMVRRRKSAETGFMAGFTTVDHTPALVLGRRSFWEVPSRRSPDILLEATALLPARGRTLFEGTVWGSYNIDATTNAMVGYGYFTESHSASIVIGAEVRVGRFRVRPAFRVSDGGFDARFTTTF